MIIIWIKSSLNYKQSHFLYYLTWLTKDWKLREAICDSFRLVWESFGRQQNCFQKRTRSQAIWRNLLDWQLWIPSRYKIKWMNAKIEILISYFQYFSTHVVLNWNSSDQVWNTTMFSFQLSSFISPSSKNQMLKIQK